MANDIMVDIESLDTTPNCVILTIGAVRFDPKVAGGSSDKDAVRTNNYVRLVRDIQ